MLERTVFLSAREKKDPVARAAYLDATCAGQPVLRQRIEQLLRCYQELEGFLDTPALEQMTAEQLLSFLEPIREREPPGPCDSPP
jgi:hypothetical protein